MKSVFKVLGVVVPLALAGAAWHRISSAQSAVATTVAYSGYLEDAGLPVDGSRNIGLNLWNAATTADPANRVCQQASATTVVSGGWFTVSLSAPCLDALRLYPSLRMEFVVDGTAFPLQTIGAVPYALRALEYTSGTRLRRMVRQGADGSKQHDSTRWWDSERGEECTFRTINGQPGTTGLCLPASSNGGGGFCDGGAYYSDAGCSALLDFSTSPYLPTTSPKPKYVASPTSPSGLASVTSSTFGVYRKCGASACTLDGASYAKGADIPAQDFVVWSEATE
jgi:hypothetical protein